MTQMLSYVSMTRLLQVSSITMFVFQHSTGCPPVSTELAGPQEPEPEVEEVEEEEEMEAGGGWLQVSWQSRTI